MSVLLQEKAESAYNKTPSLLLKLRAYSEVSNKRTAGNNRTADLEVMKLIIGPQVLIGPQD